MPRRGNLSSA